ncbi:MAG: signal recognition particle-docking protein FtsY [Candidatus Thermoplasmatota archaeon]|nr:signal recognition particle-docking protein FtsY [Candidatus Thermoplasmatota archaeon]
MFKFLKKKFKNFEEAVEGQVKKAVVEEPSEKERSVDKKIEEELRKTLELGKEFGETRKATLSLSEKKLDELLWDLEMGLLEADVALPVVEDIKNSVKGQLPYIKRKNAGEAVRETLKKAIEKILSSNGKDFDTFIKESNKPVVLMFVGVNGTGKTTTIAKLAHQLKKKGLSSVMGACDTFRAGAIEQLEMHANKIGVKLIKHSAGADPAAVAYDSVEHAKAKHKDVVLLDTAGRMQTNINLMDEMKKIKKVAKPDMIVFVGDALTGNDAVEQAKRFDEVVGIDGIILNKVDADAKGGAALSIAYTIGKPLLFIGNGQGYDDQIAFTPEWMTERLFD